MRTKCMALGVYALVAFVMAALYGCGNGNSDGQPGREAHDTARPGELHSAGESEFGEIRAVDMGDGVSIEFVDIPDANADFPANDCPDGVGFTGEMARYPTTNAQYARYLNDALGSGDVEVDGHQVQGASGPYSGQNYYRLDGPGWTGHGATDGGKSRIRYSDGVFSVDSGFENHPVTYVSWYGAMAFAERYGWRLPTAWEWESVANYNDNRTFATGSSLYDRRRFWANYRANGADGYLPNDLEYHPYAGYGTSTVGFFGYYGYGLADMAGCVWEWTSTSVAALIGTNYLLRGGSWDYTDDPCGVSYRYSAGPGYSGISRGFRVCH